MKKILLSFLLLFTICSTSILASDKPDKPFIKAETAINMLMKGNDRYIKGELKHPNNSPDYRSTLTTGQAPFAIIVACSDSRVPPELIFNQGLGDIFVIRNAGNVVDPIVLGSIEFAIQNLNTKLVMVLGHENCGAVVASMGDKMPEGNIRAIVKAIKPALEKAAHEPGNPYTNSIIDNIKQSKEQINNSEPIIKKSVLNDNVKVIGAYYNLHTGKVNIVK